jgi:DNA-binding MarR family transcriptional regulator
MLTDREQRIVNWLRTRKIATMRHLQHQFQVCHMTVFRALKKSGYHTSYNHNAGYYTLAGLPQFDDWGLWAYHEVRFSRWGTLLETLVALVQQAPAGLTASELEERLQTPVANLLARLVQHGRLQRQPLSGHRVVYLTAATEAGRQQWEQRQQQQAAAAEKQAAALPAGCPAPVVIAVLRQMILAPEESPEQGARQLQAAGLRVTARQVSRVREFYALGKKRR